MENIGQILTSVCGIACVCGVVIVAGIGFFVFGFGRGILSNIFGFIDDEEGIAHEDLPNPTRRKGLPRRGNLRAQRDSLDFDAAVQRHAGSAQQAPNRPDEFSQMPPPDRLGRGNRFNDDSPRRGKLGRDNRKLERDEIYDDGEDGFFDF